MSRQKRLDPDTEKIISDFVRRVEKELGIKVLEVIVFGSRARGDYRKDSDIDLIIVSRDWKGDILERMSKLYRIWNYEVDATLIPLTPEELERKKKTSITIRDASRHWIRIKLAKRQPLTHSQ